MAIVVGAASSAANVCETKGMWRKEEECEKKERKRKRVINIKTLILWVIR
jgi:hypothetical protein